MIGTQFSFAFQGVGRDPAGGDRQSDAGNDMKADDGVFYTFNAVTNAVMDSTGKSVDGRRRAILHRHHRSGQSDLRRRDAAEVYVERQIATPSISAPRYPTASHPDTAWSSAARVISSDPTTRTSRWIAPPSHSIR